VELTFVRLAVPVGAAGVAVDGAVVGGVVVAGAGAGIDGAGAGVVVVPDVPTGWEAGRDGVVEGVCAIAAAVLSRNSKEKGIDVFIATSSYWAFEALPRSSRRG
jgi:hypothetical protein